MTLPLRIVFVGPPGSGKGTQGVLLAQQYLVCHLSTGDMLRQRRDESNDDGAFASYVSGSAFAPDDVMLGMITDRLSQPDCQSGWLMDGFPRTLSQAQWFDGYLDHHADHIDRVIEFVADRQVLAERLLGRAKLENRVDDTPETIAKRWEVYQDRTRPVLNHYRDLVTPIDAMQNPDAVFADIQRCLPVSRAKPQT